MLRRFTSHDVAPGTVIIHEGEQGRGLFVVLTGALEVSRRAADGEVVPLGALATGDVFGEMSLLRGALTTATVVCARPATVLFLAREYVERIVAALLHGRHNVADGLAHVLLLLPPGFDQPREGGGETGVGKGETAHGV